MSDRTGPFDDGTADDRDDELRSLLRAGVAADAPTEAEAEDELGVLRPRFEHARRRRQTGLAVAGAAAAVLVVVLGLAALGGDDRQQLDTADRSTLPTASTSTTTTTTAPGPTPTTVGVPGEPEATAPPTSLPGTPGPGSTLPSAPTTATPSGPAAPPTTTTPPAPAGGTQEAVAAGGSATLTWTPTSLTVVSTRPAPGWSVERVERPDATRAVIRFRRDGGGSGSSTSTIDARMRDGALEVQT
ncbi:hypothetical protein [Dermatobacter hominis]|uniref:hypothetical protein n=1 Tax=Dermatobacter hominis TaxID=2884263 RepID=UPI001D11D42A|nr:hypothetical protein [Dermatobacter hominis]UDY35232.1 hypothetical protein LH044_18070 [Dermatobacter hominis]